MREVMHIDCTGGTQQLLMHVNGKDKVCNSGNLKYNVWEDNEYDTNTKIMFTC